MLRSLRVISMYIPINVQHVRLVDSCGLREDAVGLRFHSGLSEKAIETLERGTTEGQFFARLLLIFTISVANKTYSICLVEPLDAPIGPLPQRTIDNDRELGLHRVRARQNERSKEFIFARTIIRGAPMIRDFDREGH
jgi:hypothetical protein